MTGLKNKVVGYQFKETLDIIDPITRTKTKEPLKQFMVNQLCLSFERDRIALCPFDETLHKQLIDYEVDHISQSGLPVYTSVNEHFVDALGLAHLAFVLKFPEITQAIEGVKLTSKIEHSNKSILNLKASQALREISTPSNPWKRPLTQIGKAPGERKGDYQQWVQVPMKGASRSGHSSGWGSRSGNSFGGRSMW